MHAFEFTRPADPASAVATAAQSKTAQQGADVRFVAGGTTLIDLMKLNVEIPARVLDINRLPLDKIEATPDGGHDLAGRAIAALVAVAGDERRLHRVQRVGRAEALDGRDLFPVVHQGQTEA